MDRIVLLTGLPVHGDHHGESRHGTIFPYGKEASLFNKSFMTSPIGKYVHRYFLFRHPFFNTSADDKLKWIPYAAVFFLDAFGFNAKSGWKQQLVTAGATEAIRYGIADSLKKIVHEHRPAPYMGRDSFPSGHASSSFAGAEFMHAELKDSMPVLSYAGYLGAALTAGIRVAKNRHWLIDVAAGAAVGILSAKLSYFLINRLQTRRKKQMNARDAEVSPEVVDQF